MRTIHSWLPLAAGSLVLAVPALTLAHHGIGAQFDLSSSIELQGELERVLWRNPHVRLTLRVTNDAGGEEFWEVEAQSVSMLRQRDIVEVLLEEGDSISLVGNPAHGGATEIYVTNVLLPDGRELLFSQGAEPYWNDAALGTTGPRFVREGDGTAPELGLFRPWTGASPQAFYRGLPMESPPLTEQALASAQAYDPVTDNAGTGECTPKGMPGIMSNPYPREFVDQGDTIVMRLEEYDTVRTIHMTETAPGAPSMLGHSVGRWDEDTLVVNTTHFGPQLFRQGIWLSEDLEIIERITPSADGSRLHYEATATDPAAFVEPIEFSAQWIYVPGVTVEPYDCIDG